MTENTYVIAWKKKSGAEFGQGKKLLTQEEAEQLASELNQEHPDFLHEPLNLHAAASLGVTEPMPSAELETVA